MTTLADLEKGYEFPPASFDLSEEWVDAYVASVEDGAIAALDGEFVPPMAVAALAIRALLDNVSLPWVTLHTRQVLKFVAPVRRGEALAVSACIASRSEHAGMTWMRVELCVKRDGQTVMTGWARISFPLAEEADLKPQAAPHPAGTAFPTVTKTITQEKIDAYALAGGDPNPLHTDLDRAATTPFGGTIAHGMLLLAYVSEMLTAALGEDWLASSELDAKFPVPARPEDTVTASGTETSGGKTVYKVECRNGSGVVLVSGKAEVSQ